MKRIISTALFVLAVTLLSFSVEKTFKLVLKFRPDGKFKIVQFTDVHYQYDSYRSDSALVLMKSVIASEKPDLIVLTGDVVCSKNTTKAWMSLSNVFIHAKIPWAVVLGNHDAQYELTKVQIMKTIVGLPYNLTKNGPKNVSGNGNYVLKVQASNSEKTAAIFYCLDSHMGFHPKTNLGSYEWFDFSQIGWYREQSSKFTKQNDGKPLPALAFFHIPLPEYKEVVGKSTTVGSQIETICSPDLNSGMYTAMLEGNDVMGMFAGHDHSNNYIGCLRGICLAYGNVTGRQCYGDIGRGARVIELYEGQRKFDTWVLKLYECNRDKDIWVPATDRQPKYFVTYPDSFKEPEPVPSK
jgi:predicted phosphodiesterase